MADMAELEKSFAAFSLHGKGKADQMTGKNFVKCLKDCKILDKKMTSNAADIEFTKVKTKGAKVITFGQFKTALTNISTTKKCEADDLFKLVVSGSPQNTGVTTTSKTGNVGKMTDTSQYTGAHKQRFDESGKGKGLSGREELVENTGYVGDYKGDGTYDKKVGK